MPSIASPYKHPVHGTYYLRVAVPHALRSSIQKTMIKKSLDTKDYWLAKQRFSVMYVEVMSLFHQHRLNMSDSHISKVESPKEWVMGPISKGNLSAISSSPESGKISTYKQPIVIAESFKSLGEVVGSYILHKQSVRDWQSTTEKDVLNIYGLLLDELGEATNPSDITREQFRSFIELLSKLPAYYTNNKKFSKCSLKKVIAIADEEDLKRITPSTARKKFSFVKALVKFAVQEEWMDKDRTKGVQIKTEGTVAVRKPYTEAEIKVVMSATRHKKRPSDYWMPRIALTTGMRANEILQLLVKDIKCHEGLWYFDINENVDPHTGYKKKLKTMNSIRKVPIPKALLDLEFLGFVQGVKEGRLFPCVTRSHDGRYSYIYSKRFNWMISQLGLKPDVSLNELKDFHSFRHTFRANCREYGISNDDANLIGGWTSNLDPTTGDRYGREFFLFMSSLKNSLDQIKYNWGIVGSKAAC